MKKRPLFALTLALITALAWFSVGAWQASRVPATTEAAAEHLQRKPLAYAVIDGTPLVLAEFGGSYFLDTLQLDLLSMEFPPYPRWQWTGDWERIDTPNAPATANLSAHFGPVVIFGLMNDERITAMEIERDGDVVQRIPLTGPAYILLVTGVLLTDDVHFITSDGDRVITDDLMD